MRTLPTPGDVENPLEIAKRAPSTMLLRTDIVTRSVDLIV
jgi:hypothetical protein